MTKKQLRKALVIQFRVGVAVILIVLTLGIVSGMM